MDLYAYRIGDDVHELRIEPSEAKMLVSLRPFSQLDPGVLVVHRAGLDRRVRRTALAERARILFGFLDAQRERLPYRYTVTERLVGKYRPQFGGGSVSCTFAGERASLETGPGYCRIVAFELGTPDAREQRRIAPEVGEDVDERWLGTGSVSTERVLHDLRDLEPVTIDRGRIMRAARRRWDTTILEKLADLASFLDACDAEWVEVSVRENA